jgi:hypothetical protein
MVKNKEFDIERKSYDEKVEKIRKKKRKLRDLQDPALVKKIKKDLKVEQRGAKRSANNELRTYLKNEIDGYTYESKPEENDESI